MAEEDAIKEFTSNLFSLGQSSHLELELTLDDLPLLTGHLARKLQQVEKASVHIALSGFLSAGKTTFVRELAKSLNLKEADCIESPTFSYFHPYALNTSSGEDAKHGKKHDTKYFVHYDLHRLPKEPNTTSESIEQLGIDEYLEKEGIHCIEWAERLNPGLLSEHTLWIEIQHSSQPASQKSARRLYRLRAEKLAPSPASPSVSSSSSSSTKTAQEKASLQKEKDQLNLWNSAASRSQFLASFDHLKELEDYLKTNRSHPHQVAFVGRSNVGKSSLLNTLFGRKGFARVSKTPGKTRQFVLFSLPDLLHVIDLPGYGYAQVSAKEQERWHKEIALYFKAPPKLTLLLIDSRHGIKDSDQQMINYFAKLKNTPNKSKLLCVFTKWDKIPSSKRRMRRKELLSQIEGIPGVVFHRSCEQLKQQLVLKVMQLTQ